MTRYAGTLEDAPLNNFHTLASLGISNTMFIAAAISFVGAWSAWAMAPETRSLDLQQAAAV